MISVRTSTGLKDIVSAKVRTASGLKAAAVLSVRTASGLEVVWSGVNAIVATIPPNAFGGAANGSSIAVASEVVSVSVTGGKAPYSYVWSKVGAPDSNWLIPFATASETRFQHTAVPAYDSRTASFICTVTDSNGASVASGECDVLVENFGGLF